MKRGGYIRFFLFSAIAGWGMGCLEVESYPDEPAIAFNAFTVEGGRGSLIIDFTDGDGDIGLDDDDTTGVFCPDTCRFHYNLFCEYYELQNGAWVHIPLDPELLQVPFWYRVPRVRPSGQNPALNGEIKIDMPTYFLPSAFDTCRFEIQLYDRALRGSNKIVTPEIVKR